jgi:hypothetical protein
LFTLKGLFVLTNALAEALVLRAARLLLRAPPYGLFLRAPHRFFSLALHGFLFRAPPGLFFSALARRFLRALRFFSRTPRLTGRIGNTGIAGLYARTVVRSGGFGCGGGH